MIPKRVGPPTRLGRVFLFPWYPWGVAVVPILHFLTSNPLHFAARGAVVPAAGALLAVTVAVAGLRLVLRDWHQAAAAVTAVTVVFFAYGHVERVLEGRLDEYVLFPSGIVLAAAVVGSAVRHPVVAARWAPFLNVTTSMLLMFQIMTIAGSTSDVFSSSSSEPLPADNVTSHLFAQYPPPLAGHGRPDIYYIILDAYARHDALGEFDNTAFLRELERRGFYIANDATSNYMNSIQSLASSLNLSYLHDLGPRSPKTERDAIALAQDNALAAILEHLGYVYIHLESGHAVTSTAPRADVVVTFTPEGVLVAKTARGTGGSYVGLPGQDEAVDGAFLHTLAHTTVLRPLLGNRLRPSDDKPYQWWAPERALQMFDFLSEPIESAGPKVVFAHIIKPHIPATFDRYGNMFLSKGGRVGFSDAHDPSVPDAYIGQLIFINSLVLSTVDSILENHDEEPIIVIAGDHGRTTEYPKHPILAAFHLPDGGTEALYPSISSVNHFRIVLDYYFGLNLGLLEDVQLEHEKSQFEIEATAAKRVSS